MKKEQNYKVRKLTHKAQLIKRNIRVLLVILIFMVFIVPIMIWFLHSAVCWRIPCDISADGMLNYNGALIGSISTFTVAIISLWQSTVALGKDEERRKNEIRPVLLIKVTKIEENIFKLKVKNIGRYSASNIALYECDFTDVIGANSSVTRTFSDKVDSKGIIKCSSFACELTEQGYPKEIDITYYDEDGNGYSQIFKIDKNVKNVQYVSRKEDLIEL